MKLTRINYDNGYLWVDKKAKIKVNDRLYNDLEGIGTYIEHEFGNGIIINYDKRGLVSEDEENVVKIVAQTNLDLLNLLYVEVKEEDIEVEATKAYREYCKEKNITEHLLDSSTFYLGYKAAQAKSNLHEILANFYNYATNGEVCKHEVINKYIESLNKIPNEIEIELGHTEFGSDSRYNIKPLTYTRDNKTYLKVK